MSYSTQVANLAVKVMIVKTKAKKVVGSPTTDTNQMKIEICVSAAAVIANAATLHQDICIVAAASHYIAVSEQLVYSQ